MIAALKRQWTDDWSEIVGGAIAGGGVVAFAWLALAVFNAAGG